MRLRWRVGSGEYVETYEHRVVGDRVTTAASVHHKDRVKDNNTYGNLVHCETHDEHMVHHRQIDYDAARRLYENEGLTTVEIGRLLDCSPATLSRVLRGMGVTMRSPGSYTEVSVDREKLVALCNDPLLRVPQVARMLGVPTGVVRDRMRRWGIKPWPVGNPRVKR